MFLLDEHAIVVGLGVGIILVGLVDVQVFVFRDIRCIHSWMANVLRKFNLT